MSGLILDVAIVVIVLLLVIFGTWRGMWKLIFGLVSGLAAIALAVVLTSTVAGLVVTKTNLVGTYSDVVTPTIESVIPEDLDAENVYITYTTETDSETKVQTTTVTLVHGEEELTGEEAITNYVEEKGGMLGSVVKIFASNELGTKIVQQSKTTASEDGDTVEITTTLKELMVSGAIGVLLSVIVFLVLWIVLFVVLRLLMMLLKKVVTRTYVGYFVDKALGFAIGLVIGMVIVWGALAVVKLLGTYTWIISVNNLIEDSTLTKLLYDNNILYNLLIDGLNLQDLIAQVVGMLGNIGSIGQGGTDAATDAETAARMIASVTAAPMV